MNGLNNAESIMKVVLGVDAAESVANRLPLNDPKVMARIEARFALVEGKNRDDLWFKRLAKGPAEGAEMLLDRLDHAHKHLEALMSPHAGVDDLAAVAWFVFLAIHIEEATGVKLNDVLDEARTARVAKIRAEGGLT